MTLKQIVLSIFLIVFSMPVYISAGDYSQYMEYVPPAEYYGRVVLNNFSKRSGTLPVSFDHWSHRAQFTCRLCHIDIGFAMKAEETGISASDNMSGYYCGSCHDGRREIEGKKIFAACADSYSEEEGRRCVRCHSGEEAEERKQSYKVFAGKMPQMSGGLIDWEKAEEEGKIKLTDFLEGVSYKREPLKVQDDFAIKVTSWASDVIFSHKKHTVWNGCELCHPLVFPSSKKGTIKYSMFQIMEGEYCGACHLSVAFSVWLCAKCHTSPVE